MVTIVTSKLAITSMQAYLKLSYLSEDSEVTETIKRKYAGQSRDILARSGQLIVPGEVSIFPGNSVENRDCCPGKSVTDGHLT